MSHRVAISACLSQTQGSAGRVLVIKERRIRVLAAKVNIKDNVLRLKGIVEPTARLKFGQRQPPKRWLRRARRNISRDGGPREKINGYSITGPFHGIDSPSLSIESSSIR